MTVCLWLRGQVRVLGIVAALLPAAGLLEASPPLDPASQYRVRADGTLTVSGPRCCGTTRFTGRLEASYAVRSSGDATVGSLRFALDDASVVVHDGFLGLFSRHIDLRCAHVSTPSPAPGRFDGVDKIDFAAGALVLSGISSEERYPTGTCADPTLTLEAANDTPAAFRHDPARNLFAITGSFRTTIEGETYVFAVAADGRFDNRPPVAGLGIETPAQPQGGCPAYWRRDVQGVWEQVAEANNPAGLVGTLRSDSTDPDPPGARGDILADRWFRTRGTGARERAGDGARTGPATFEWGPVHRLELLSLDHRGASDAALCSFRVIDTRPPVVTPPAPVTLGCTTTGGASGAGSAQLHGFLASGVAADAADATPVRLPPLLGATVVTDSTVFPADGLARSVRFRFQDHAGNLGAADSSVTVQDVTPPSLAVASSPPVLPPNNKFYWIAATLSGTDNCGLPLRFRLVAIKSNAPAYDAGDILDAAYGTDDRGFFLYSRQVPLGAARFYKIYYEAIDNAGNVKGVVAQVVVG